MGGNPGQPASHWHGGLSSTAKRTQRVMSTLSQRKVHCDPTYGIGWNDSEIAKPEIQGCELRRMVAPLPCLK